MGQCTAMSKQSRERCKRFAKPGRTTCNMHGGNTRRGMANPVTKHGRYSKHLPTRLAASFHESINDPNILELSAEIALITSRIEELIESLGTGETGRLWRELTRTNDELMAARRRGDTSVVPGLIAELSRLIVAGDSGWGAWAELKDLTEARRKLVDSEQKRRVAMASMISAEQAMILVAALTESVRRHVDDANALRAIADDFTALIERSSH